MPGKATRPDDGRRNNRGTIGNKGGRPKLDEIRKQHALRAFDDEWEIIKDFAKIVKKDKETARKAVESLNKRLYE